MGVAMGIRREIDSLRIDSVVVAQSDSLVAVEALPLDARPMIRDAGHCRHDQATEGCLGARIVIVFSVLASATDFFVIFNMRLLSLLASSAILPALLLLACVAFVAW